MKLALAGLFLISSVIGIPSPVLAQALAGQPLEWSELEDAGRFHLRQDVPIENTGVIFREGQEFHLVALHGIEGISMIYAEAYAVQCPDLEAHTDEVTLVLPRPTDKPDPVGRDRRVAVDLKRGCHIGIYIEAADYYWPSFFQTAAN